MAVYSPDTSTDHSKSKTRILVIDDSAVIRKAATKMLGNNFDIVVAVDGEQGWREIQQDKSIAVVFTDINMPNMDGYELIEKVRTSHDEGVRNLPLIVITSEDSESGAKERVFKLGATDFITKPFNSFDLIARANAHYQYQRITQVLQQQSRHEPVSGLLNKQGLHQQLSKDISLIKRERKPLALFHIEICNFKDIFLQVGRASADKIIQLIAERLQGLIRQEDSVARYSLSTFTLISPAAAPASAAGLAQRIMTEITSINATIEGSALNFQVAIGICTVDAGCNGDSEQLLLEGEQALLTAKQMKHGKVHTCAIKQAGADREIADVSIDKLLRLLKKGDKSIPVDQLKAAKVQLKPLLALIDE